MRGTHNIDWVQFTGSNSADVIQAAEDYFTLTNAGIDFISGSQVGDNVEIITSQYTLVVEPTQFLVRDRTDVGTQTSEYHPINYRTPGPLKMGNATTPAILAGQDAVIPVDFIGGAFADEDYTAAACLAGSASLLADLAVTAVAIVDSGTVNVTVHNGGLLSLSGATVVVTALHN